MKQADKSINGENISWAKLVRQYLALQNECFLEQSISEAEKKSEPKVAKLLKSLFTEEDPSPVIIEISRLSDVFDSSGKFEESLSLRMIVLDYFSRLTEQFVNFPPAMRLQMREKGIQACQEAIFLAELLDDEACRAFYTATLGCGFSHGNQFKEAVPLFRKALRFYRRLAGATSEDYKADLAKTLNNLATALRHIRKLKEAEKTLREALRIYCHLAEKDPQTFQFFIAAILNNLALLLGDLRRFDEAEQVCREALTIKRKLAEENTEFYLPDVGVTLNNLGIILGEVERAEEAESIFREALQIYREISDEEAEVHLDSLAVTLNNLAVVLVQLRNFREAREIAQEALDIYRRLAKEDPEVYQANIALSLGNVADALHELNLLAEAGAAYKEGLVIYQGLAEENRNTYQIEVAITLNNLGVVLSKSGKFAEAESILQAAKEICQKRPHSDFVFATTRILSSLAQLRMREGRWGECLSIVRQGIRQAEKLYGESYSAGRAKQIIEENIALYEAQVVCLMKMNRKAYALTAAEKGKARSLSDMMHHQSLRRSDINQNYQPLAAMLTTRETRALAKKSAKTFVVFRVTHHGCYIFFVFPDGRTHVETVPDFTTTDLADLLFTMEGEEVTGGWVASYYELAKSCEARRSYAKDGTRKNKDAYFQIEQEYESFRESWMTEMDAILEELYSRLMIRVHDVLRKRGIAQGAQIVIIPNRGLGILPLHACWWLDKRRERRYLIDEYTFLYAPSLTVFEKCWEKGQNRRNEGTLLAVVNPTGDLEFSEHECRAIESLFGAANCLLLRGHEATKSSVKAEYKKKNCLHFSCHATYDVNNPLESCLFLAPAQNDGATEDDKLKFLEITEEFDLNGTWLTVLAACETALTQFESLADEYYSLSTAFLIAGTPTVWATLWAVDDESTKELLVKAYSLLRGKSKSEALRKAQLDLKKNPQFSHPIHWAGMQNIGA